MPNPVNPSPVTRKRGERGATILLFTFCAFLLVIPMVGLAIDGSIALWTKAKLSAAVDAAALAAGRSMTSSGTFQQQQVLAEQAATSWFAANFPAGWLNTTIVNGGPTVSVQESSKTITATVQASVIAPLFFMRIFGSNFQNVTVSETAQSSRRNLVLILVLDRSGSMETSDSCDTMIADAQSFVNYFTDGFDELGLVTFSSSANPNLDYPPNLYFKSSSPTLNSVIEQIQCAGATSTTQAMNIAYSAIKQVDQPLALNVIVLFTDGQPNAIEATNWPIKSSSSCNDPNGSKVIPGSITTTTANQLYGIYDPSKYTGITQGGTLSFTGDNSSGCKFKNNLTYVGQDIASIPSQDAFGNLTTGYQGSDLDLTANDILASSFNTADNQALTIRQDTTFQPVIFTIGLGNSGLDGTAEQFLERVANDPRSTSYDSTLAAGEFAYAPDASELQTAFYQIASEILRLSQ